MKTQHQETFFVKASLLIHRWNAQGRRLAHQDTNNLRLYWALMDEDEQALLASWIAEHRGVLPTFIKVRF